jgi:hypothetical protein
MKRVTLLGGAIAVVLVLSLAWVARGPVAAQEPPAQPLQKWEYKQLNVLPAGVSAMEVELNKLGSEGWDLCATVVPVGRGTDEFAVSFILKRSKR